jgi:FAD/FMN-containing dehydrogenase
VPASVTSPLTAPITTSAVSPLIGQSVGVSAHQRSVEALLASYRAIPSGSGVRLAKRTSNLFRPRAAATGQGLDVRGLAGVISVDPEPAEGPPTADVQGMCTYEQLVATTLPKGLMPYVVPQLRTITLGGAVTGLGIESTSFRSGLPHESVLELDVLTGAGDLVTARPTGEHGDLFAAFPNSYGTLGYSVRLRIALERVRPYVALRNVRFGDLDDLVAAVGAVIRDGAWDGEPVDFVDGVVFSAAPGATEAYLVLGAWSDAVPAVSDYTGREIYYRSLRDRGRDALTVHDYLWRWDTDWFWCSAAFGAQRPAVRRLWPARYRRSDVYHRIVGLENRYHVAARVDRWRGRPERERVIQDVEVPLEGTADFLRWFAEHVAMSPVWLCPLRVRQEGPLAVDGPLPEGAQPWPLYPLRVGETYVNIGFWGTVPIAPGRADGDVNRLIETAVARAGGHKSLYSDAYYDEADFWSKYGGEAYRPVKDRYDPDRRLLDLYAKTVGRR